MESWQENLGHLRAVLFEEGGIWAGQILEYDIAAQAATPAALQNELVRTVATHVAACIQLGRVPFLGVSQAPPRFWASYETGTAVEPAPTQTYSLSSGGRLPPIRLQVRAAPSLANAA